MLKHMERNFLNNKRILVTGSSGFIGTHLTAYMTAQKANILGLSRHPQNKQDKKINIAVYSECKKVFVDFKPEICIHLASDALVEEGHKHPLETISNNIQSALNILELSRLSGVKKIICASTAHVYGDSPTPYVEDEPARPTRPYETSKTCVDLIAQTYANSYNLPVLIPRFVNIYGPGDLNFTRIIPRTIKSILLDHEVVMWGGNAEREYLYIDDAVDAYIRLMSLSQDQIEKNRIFNFGSEKPITASALIEQIVRIGNIDVARTHIPSDRENELDSQRVSIRKAKKSLGWEPYVGLDEGLRKTFEWYATYFQNKSV
jgi:CDP-glucose 4,6-dehydratase